MMNQIGFTNINGNYNPITIAQKNATQENNADLEKKIVIKDPLREKIKDQTEQKISMEELTKALMKPKEIKRLLYLTIPFTRHLIAELDQNKGNLLDKQG
ncbi:MAG: hypothetical protein KatS3mg129_3164 [Leptospiraceae bacterium]|nr:MAG: hypothetical protein KatS3mg129_3164 [Leptospiraceae bacterium]